MYKDWKGKEIHEGDTVGLPTPDGLIPVIVSELLENSRIRIHPKNDSTTLFTMPTKNCILIKRGE